MMKKTNNEGSRANNKWKCLLAFTSLAILAGCVLLNAYILYCKIIPVGNVKPTYDYRIAVFGNDGIYPEEAVNFASSLNDELPNAVIEQIGIKIDCRPQGYNVYCVALDSETFANWYPVPITTQRPYAVLSSFHSIGLGEIENIAVSVKNTAINIVGVNHTEIPFGAMSNVPLPNVPSLLLVTTQKVANELYAQYPVTQQRQISIYYQTEDGKTLTKQMESYSPKEVSGTQIWDCQDYTRNSLWAISTRVRKIIWNSCLIIFTSLLESVILFSAFSLKKNYYSNCPTKTTKEEHTEKQ